jgi:hypothetical protein
VILLKDFTVQGELLVHFQLKKLLATFGSYGIALLLGDLFVKGKTFGHVLWLVMRVRGIHFVLVYWIKVRVGVSQILYSLINSS